MPEKQLAALIAALLYSNNRGYTYAKAAEKAYKIIDAVDIETESRDQRREIDLDQGFR